MKHGRWFTCTPVAFGGGPDFFARDSGLLSRGFQALGIESRAVMPGEPQQGDEPDLIRTNYENLESPEWWKAHQLEGVVLYAWGRPKFRKVARAIREAGVFLVLNQDNGGLVSPLAGPGGWWREQWILAGAGRGPGSWFRFGKLVGHGLTAGLLATDPLRARHLKHGHVVACVSPVAAGHYRRLCRIYGGRDLADRVMVIPHAVEPHFRFSGEAKQRRVVCVGRWDDPVQKRAWLMMKVFARLLRLDFEVTVAIAGQTTPELDHWRNALPGPQRERVRLLGKLDRAELAETLIHSRVFYSPSAFESFGIAAAEALCSGCSVVAERSVSMSAFEWFVSENSGTLSDSKNPAAHALAIEEELKRWEAGERDAHGISEHWSTRLHALEVAAAILRLREQPCS